MGEKGKKVFKIVFKIVLNIGKRRGVNHSKGTEMRSESYMKWGIQPSFFTLSNQPVMGISLTQSLMFMMIAGMEGSNMIPPHLPVLCHDLGAAPGWVLSTMASLLCFPSST